MSNLKEEIIVIPLRNEISYEMPEEKGNRPIPSVFCGWSKSGESHMGVNMFKFSKLDSRYIDTNFGIVDFTRLLMKCLLLYNNNNILYGLFLHEVEGGLTK